MMALAETKEEVLEKLKKDTYWESGVWDESKVCVLFSSPLWKGRNADCHFQIQIYPFKSAVRSAL